MEYTTLAPISKFKCECYLSAVISENVLGAHVIILFSTITKLPSYFTLLILNPVSSYLQTAKDSWFNVPVQTEAQNKVVQLMGFSLIKEKKSKTQHQKHNMRTPGLQDMEEFKHILVTKFSYLCVTLTNGISVRLTSWSRKDHKNLQIKCRKYEKFRTFCPTQHSCLQ